MNREETKRALGEIGVAPSRAMGQNFLVDDEVSRWIVDQLEIGEGGCVVEVGAGLGALTDYLVEHLGAGGRLVVIEKDRRLAGRLAKVFSEDQRVEVREADATEVDVRPFFAEGALRVIGNLPYSVGARILETFLGEVSPVVEAVFMLQTEVAERLCASPRTKSYGALTLKVGRSWRCELLGKVGPGSFFPEPKVDSSVVRLRPREAGELDVFDFALFDRLVKAGFSQRRKQLRKLLPKHGFLGWGEIVGLLGVAETARAEELGLEEWVRLATIFGGEYGEGQRGDEMFDVVDEENAVIRQATRAQVHREELRHRAVHVFVFNRRGEIFLQKRSHLKDACPGLWDSSAAGHLDAGESYETCAVRELEEELGVKGECEFVAEIGAREETGWEFVRLYRVDQFSGKLKWPPDEIACGAFFGMEVVADWAGRRPGDFAPGFLECLRVYQEGAARFSA